MKFLIDMNLSPEWVGYLARAGFEAVHWSTVGAADAADTEVMQWAVTRSYILLTADLDFGAILAATQGTRPSVIQIRSDLLTTGAIGAAVVTAIRQTEQELLTGALISIDAGRARLRILPLTS
jgi:predicted nuclease of predicted toxin-antitoxin system